MDARVTHKPHFPFHIEYSSLDESGIDHNQSWGFIHQQTVIISFLTQMEIFNPALLRHSRTVAHYTQLMAQNLVLTPEDKDKLLNSSLLYDIGMMGVDRRIIEKDEKLSSQEREIIHGHPLHGVKILSPFPFFREILPIIMHHHEWYDGTGYPTGLMGEDIPFMSRVITIADIFVALTSDRPYRSAFPINEAIDIIKQNKGKQFDPQLVPHFINVVKDDFYNNINLMDESAYKLSSVG